MCDIGSFAPRDYTADDSKQLDPAALHNRSVMPQKSFPSQFSGKVVVGRSEFEATGVLGEEGTSGWYQRVENNGWRAVTVKAQHELREDSVEVDSAAQTKSNFHFSKLVRKKDVEAMKKKKKREWLRRMYEIGLAKEREPGRMDIVEKQATIQQQLMSGTNEKDMDMFNQHMKARGEDDCIEIDSDGEVDVEVEKLLSWTSNLDYDRYLGNWATIGTSGTSGARGSVENPASESKLSADDEDPERETSSEFFDYGLGFN